VRGKANASVEVTGLEPMKGKQMTLGKLCHQARITKRLTLREFCLRQGRDRGPVK